MPVDLGKLDLIKHGSIGDLSPEGVFIATEDSFEKGDRLEIHLKFPRPGEQTAEVSIKGKVMWTGQKIMEDTREIVSGIGVRFIDLDSETLEQVMSLYERIGTQLS